ncbi:EthD family reductase [Alteromonadaceae bacterium BrNp21-10]|nr:EthD family reductase [Alteromonadaceae bacterium BrNp21-10]
MSEVKLMVLYPQPTDTEQFANDYKAHVALLHQKMNIPTEARPYQITTFLPSPTGDAAFYHMFSMPFPSIEVLQQTMGTPEMQEIAADAVRISSGGAPVVLVGSDWV